jgi:hypothetical protein
MVGQGKIMDKAEVRLTVGSTLPYHQAIAYSTSCSKAVKEIDLLQDGGKIKQGKIFDHHSARTIPNICHLQDPPTFLLVPTFKKGFNLFISRYYPPALQASIVVL